MRAAIWLGICGAMVWTTGARAQRVEPPPPSGPSEPDRPDRSLPRDSAGHVIMGPSIETAPQDDRLFLTRAAGINLAELKLARLALQRAANVEVRSFADRMLADHGAASDELRDLAAQKGISLASEPPADARAAYERLSRLSGADFDRAYMEQMKRDHDLTLELYRAELDFGFDRDLKSWVRKTLPTLRADDDLAHQSRTTL